MKQILLEWKKRLTSTEEEQMIQFSMGLHENDETDRPWYDTTEGITGVLTSLVGLYKLVSERHIAGYQRNERLNHFYILNGRYSLDTCGNCGTVSGIPKEIISSEIPLVLSHDDFFVFMKKRTVKEPMICTSMDGGNIPRPNLTCPQCGSGWLIENCHDTEVFHTTTVFPLAEHVGKSLGVVKHMYTMRTDAVYRMQPDVLVRNDRYIDFSLKYPDTEDEWRKGIVVNEHGWLSEREGVTDEYVIQDGDEGFFNVWRYFHKACHIQSVAENPKFLGENGRFKNLAGTAYADTIIEKELTDAGIEIFKDNNVPGEVPCTFVGKFGNFLFIRAWKYWMVSCMMPIEAAQEMYKDAVGGKYVRVAGHCGCPDPEEWAVSSKGKKFVQSYHIDTMPGLKLLVDTIKKYGLA